MDTVTQSSGRERVTRGSTVSLCPSLLPHCTAGQVRGWVWEPVQAEPTLSHPPWINHLLQELAGILQLLHCFHVVLCSTPARERFVEASPVSQLLLVLGVNQQCPSWWCVSLQMGLGDILMGPQKVGGRGYKGRNHSVCTWLTTQSTAAFMTASHLPEMSILSPVRVGRLHSGCPGAESSPGRGRTYFSRAVSAFSVPWLLSIHFSTRFPARKIRLVLFFFPFSVPRILMTYMRQERNIHMYTWVSHSRCWTQG